MSCESAQLFPSHAKIEKYTKRIPTLILSQGRNGYNKKMISMYVKATTMGLKATQIWQQDGKSSGLLLKKLSIM